MSSTQAVYLVNVLICAVLALLLTNLWLRAQRERSLGTFMAAAWVFLAADSTFALREAMPYWTGRFFPTLLVTVGQVVLLMGALRVTHGPDRGRLATGITLAHAVVLAVFIAFFDGVSSLRTITNGLLWAGLSFAAALVMRRAVAADVRAAMRIPALVFTLHGGFHLMRTTFAVLTISGINQGTPAWIQTAGDIEVAVFMVGLFGALLAGYTQLRGVRLLKAERDLHELSTLLPICAWCKNVRSDEGYWQRLEDYLAAKGNVQVTHAMCDSCKAKALTRLETT